jgi:hypothetical protein
MVMADRRRWSERRRMPISATWGLAPRCAESSSASQSIARRSARAAVAPEASVSAAHPLEPERASGAKEPHWQAMATSPKENGSAPCYPPDKERKRVADLRPISRRLAYSKLRKRSSGQSVAPAGPSRSSAPSRRWRRGTMSLTCWPVLGRPCMTL